MPRPRSCRCRPKAAAAAILEAAAAGVPFVVCITEGIPAQDEATGVQHAASGTTRAPACSARTARASSARAGATSASRRARSPSPRSPGKPSVGIVSRSGTLTYQALYELKQHGVGVSTCVGLGGDPVPGTSFIDALAAFEADPETAAVFMIGEIGGSAEEEAAAFIESEMTKPVVAYIAGVTAPPGRRWATPAPS